MSDVFISYKREEQPEARRLAAALEQVGISVWWDEALLSGDKFRDVIREVIDQCGAVIVLWSPLAVKSQFVVDEATHAQRTDKLLPAIIEPCDFPFGFGDAHADDLSTWDGQIGHSGFTRLLKALENKLDKKAMFGAGTPMSAAQRAEMTAFQAAAQMQSSAAWKKFLKQYPGTTFRGFIEEQIATNPGSVTAPVSALPAPAQGSWKPVIIGSVISTIASTLIFSAIIIKMSAKTDAEGASAAIKQSSHGVEIFAALWFVGMFVALGFAYKNSRKQIFKKAVQVSDAVSRRIASPKKITNLDAVTKKDDAAEAAATQKMTGAMPETGSEHIATDSHALKLTGVLDNGKSYRCLVTLSKDAPAMVFGRHSALVDYKLIENSISKRHFRLSYKDEDSIWLEDLNAHNGTSYQSDSLIPFVPVPVSLDKGAVFEAAGINLAIALC